REKERFETAVVELTRGLARVIEPQAMSRKILDAFERTDRVTHAAVYALDGSGRGLSRLGKLGPSPALGPDDPAARPALDRLSGGEVLITDASEAERGELERDAARRGRQKAEGYAVELGALARALRGMEAGVAVPFARDSRLLGFLTLRDERLREA